jgi:hypothetical protein
MTRLLGLINGVQRIVHRSITHEEKKKKKKKMRRLYDDAIVHTVIRERERTEKKKRCRDRCQVNDLEHILSERKKSLLMIECLKCVTAAALSIRSVHIHMYVHTWLLCIRLKRRAILFF